MPLWDNFLVDLIILVVVFTVIVVGSLRWKPRLWLQDFPDDIQALVEPKTPEEKRLTAAIGVVFFVALLGLLVFFTARVKDTMGADFTFFTGWLYAFSLFLGVNVWDWLVIDWIGLTLIDPQKPPFPGTEGAAGYRNYAFHFYAFLKGCVIAMVIGLIVAGIVVLIGS